MASKTIMSFTHYLFISYLPPVTTVPLQYSYVFPLVYLYFPHLKRSSYVTPFCFLKTSAHVTPFCFLKASAYITPFCLYLSDDLSISVTFRFKCNISTHSMMNKQWCLEILRTHISMKTPNNLVISEYSYIVKY